MYISNRGNNNSFDDSDILLSKLPIVNADGEHTQQLDIDGGVLSSSDGFDISADGTKLLIANFHGHGVRSASLATGFDLSSTFALTGSQKSSGGNGVRACSWNNDGTKYYMGYGTSGSTSTIRQFTAATAYETASGDTEGSALNLSYANVSDILFNSDGSKMWVSQHTGYVREYTLSTPFDPTSQSLDYTLDLTTFFDVEGVSPWRPSSNTGTTPWLAGISWNDDGSKLYVITLWGVTKASAVTGAPLPASVTGEGEVEPTLSLSLSSRLPQLHLMEVQVLTSLLQK